MPVRLQFGTAGIRARMGRGDHELNPESVRAVADALTGYLLEVVPGAAERGLCVGFDGRAHSEAFAREVCAVALARGFVVRRFVHTVPTPLLAFCTRLHGAAAGVMITASHNPPEDNGIKVFWQGGAQVVAPHDREIAARIAASDPAQVPTLALDAAEAEPRLLTLGESDEAAYLDALVNLVPGAAAALTEGSPAPRGLPRIAYSALCGVGSAVTRKLLARLGVSDVLEVREQAEPRADFGGLSSPNPEHGEALARVLALAETHAAGLAFAHDPDADRLAVAIRTREGPLLVLTGDQVGALLGAFMLELDGEPRSALLVSTLVSGGLLAAIAGAHGAHYERTLTGFKHIASRARLREQREGLRFLFGYEEAIGYAFGALGDDKDGIAALRVLLELARRLHARGRTLEDELERLHRAHGLYVTRQITMYVDAASMPARVAEVRQLSAEALIGEGAQVTDYLRASERADLVVFEHASGTRLCVRPSGTEPKLKFYLEARSKLAPEESIATALTRVDAELEALAVRLECLLSG
jgi:phosphomannomutase